ncbi:MAG: uracil-DNA glycosylase [Acidimicrobiia bacterium]
MVDELIHCRLCPRLVAWREEVAQERRAAFRDQVYWGRPVPAFGEPGAPLLIVGLAPAAHGANRTGRMFTGDRSGDFLYGSLHRTGFANQPTATVVGDGLTLHGCMITAVVRCAPPANRPTTEERTNCSRWLGPELLDPRVRVVVALGAVAFTQVIRLGREDGWVIPRPAPRFGHGVEMPLGEGRHLLGSYHPSQQNTFTGRLTPAMLDRVFSRARRLLTRDDVSEPGPPLSDPGP